MEFDEWSKSMDAFFKASARVMRKGGAMIMFMAIHQGGNYNTACREAWLLLQDYQEYGIRQILCHEI